MIGTWVDKNCASGAAGVLVVFPIGSSAFTSSMNIKMEVERKELTGGALMTGV